MHRPLLLLTSLLCIAAAGCSIPTVLVQPVSNSPALEETVVRPGKTSRRKVAVIEVEGLLANATTGGGFLGTEENKVSLFRQQLGRAAADDRVKAVVLRINSPGGTVAASEAMYGDLRKFQEKTGKPVVAACQDVAASGAYYVAAAADEIHAAPGSLVGSIGVIFQTLDVSPLLDDVGIQITPITSGPLKDLASPFDGLSDAERDVLSGIVAEMHAQFTGVVLEHRNLADPSQAFDGRVYTGRGAVAAGLVDVVTDLDASLDRAAELADAEGASVVMYKRPYGYRGSVYATGPTLEVPGAAAIERMASALLPGAYYLWMP
jgi:protease-4